MKNISIIIFFLASFVSLSQTTGSQSQEQLALEKKNNSIYKVLLKNQKAYNTKLKCPDCAETGAKEAIKNDISKCDELIKANGKEKATAVKAKEYYQEVLKQNKFETYYFSETKAIVKILYLKSGMGTVHPIYVGKIGGKWKGFGHKDNGYDQVKPSNVESEMYQLWMKQREKERVLAVQNTPEYKQKKLESDKKQQEIKEAEERAKNGNPSPNLSNELIAKFKYTDQGDYLHIIFEGEDGKEYDFGSGKNEYGAYVDLEDATGSEKYIGKKFKITWKNVMTSSYNTVEEKEVTYEAPTIIKIEMIK